MKGYQLNATRKICHFGSHFRSIRTDHAAGHADGLPGNLSVHPGGVVIAADLLSMSPVDLSAKGFPVIQFDKDDAAALGFVKLDLPKDAHAKALAARASAASISTSAPCRST